MVLKTLCSCPGDWIGPVFLTRIRSVPCDRTRVARSTALDRVASASKLTGGACTTAAVNLLLGALSAMPELVKMGQRQRRPRTNGGKGPHRRREISQEVTMSIRRFTEVEAYQHADDGYYYRPLVAGKELFSYVAHVPAGGYMPPDAEEAELFELSLFMLEGHLDGILDEERVALTPGDALHIPQGDAVRSGEQGF